MTFSFDKLFPLIAERLGEKIMVEKKLVTAHELAEILDLSVDTIWRYTRENHIPHIEVGPRQYRYVKSDVLQALQKRDPVGLVQEQQAEYSAQPKLTYEDYVKIPNEPGYTLQLIDGRLIREPKSGSTPLLDCQSFGTMHRMLSAKERSIPRLTHDV